MIDDKRQRFLPKQRSHVRIRIGCARFHLAASSEGGAVAEAVDPISTTRVKATHGVTEARGGETVALMKETVALMKMCIWLRGDLNL